MKRNGLTQRILYIIEQLPVYAIISFFIGLWILIFPERALETTLRISGAILLVYALYRFVAVFIIDNDAFESSVSLFSTVATLTLGILLTVNPLFVAGILSTLFGIYLIITGIFGIWRASVLKEHYEVFGIVEDASSRRMRFITAIISFILGLLLVIFPLTVEKFTAVVTGICLVTEGAKSIVFKIIHLYTLTKGTKTKDIEADFVDKSDTI
jgi:uncharacterized membrane protein HdeD (DUF308 family)